MNFRTLLSWSSLTILLIIVACSETPSSKNRQPIILKMDIPQPKRLPQSPIKPKSFPKVEKSNIDFNLNPNGGNTPTVSSPIQDLKSCLHEVVQMEMIKNQIHGGLWGGLERTKNFKEYSPIGMQIDSKVNKVVHAFRHLCTTAKGLTYSPIAKFVLESLLQKSEEEFKRELIAKGESKEDAEIYIHYGLSAKEAKDRNIPYSAIQPSIRKARLFVKHYQVFYNRLKDTKTQSTNSLMPDLMAYSDALDSFLAEDANVKIAVKEDFEKPFWMVDGDM